MVVYLQLSPQVETQQQKELKRRTVLLKFQPTSFTWNPTGGNKCR